MEIFSSGNDIQEIMMHIAQIKVMKASTKMDLSSVDNLVKQLGENLSEREKNLLEDLYDAFFSSSDTAMIQNFYLGFFEGARFIHSMLRQASPSDFECDTTMIEKYMKRWVV